MFNKKILYPEGPGEQPLSITLLYPEVQIS